MIPLSALALSCCLVGQVVPPPQPVVQKIVLQRVQVADLMKELVTLPQPRLAILGYPLDNSVMVRGLPDDINEYKRALSVLDSLAIQGERMTLTPFSASVERLALVARSLPQSGIVEVDGKVLILKNNENWLKTMRVLAYLAELSNPEFPVRSQPQSIRGLLFIPGKVPVLPPASDTAAPPVAAPR